MGSAAVIDRQTGGGSVSAPYTTTLVAAGVTTDGAAVVLKANQAVAAGHV